MICICILCVFPEIFFLLFLHLNRLSSSTAMCLSRSTRKSKQKSLPSTVTYVLTLPTMPSSTFHSLFSRTNRLTPVRGALLLTCLFCSCQLCSTMYMSYILECRSFLFHFSPTRSSHIFYFFIFLDWWFRMGNVRQSYQSPGQGQSTKEEE